MIARLRVILRRTGGLVLVPLWLTGCALAPTPVPTLPPAAVTVRPASSSGPPPTPLRPTLPPVSSPTPMPPTNSAAQTQALTQQLIQAAAAGDTPAVLNLLGQGALINGQDARGRTAIMAATHANQVETVRALIAAGADINLRDDRLDNPFLYAGAEGLLDILRLTIAAGADTRLTNRFGGTALIPACERGHVEVVRELLTRTDVDVNHVNNLGWTALLEAIILSDGGPRHQEIVGLLLKHGADPNIPDGDGVTPLAHARQRGYAEIVALLEAAGAR